MKTCSKCKIEKNFEEFVKHKSSKDGFFNQCKVCKKEYNIKNKEKISETVKKYYQLNKDKIKKYQLNNNIRIKEYKKQYNKEYQSNRKKIDPIFKFNYNTRSLIRRSFKRGNNQFSKNAKSQYILGCTIEEFKSYIESKFTEGMNFENYGKWHLDHIKPIKLATTEEDIIKLNHYTNFQPLWAFDNLSKGSKY
jgi:hypothetical protein